MKLISIVPKKTTSSKTLGRLLNVGLPDLGISSIEAKVDTGAFSGAVHATKIREVTDKYGNKQLSFLPHGQTKEVVKVNAYHKRRIKSSNGHTALRYAIDTEIELSGQNYPIRLTLTDRSVMKCPMLIGRDFLRLNNFLVDVNLKNS